MTPWIGNTTSGAVFSPCRQYRYTLWRRWVDECPLGRMCCFIGLNPSTADETLDDPTIRRCIGFSKAWGFDGYVMLNAFAYRATDPKVMKRQVSPVGERNAEAIAAVAAGAGRVVVAWGNHGEHANQCQRVIDLLPSNVLCLGTTSTGQPKHPLYLASNTTPIAFVSKKRQTNPI